MIPRSVVPALLAFCVGEFLAASTAEADWPQFRGVNSSGIAAGSPPPIAFGPGQNELWRCQLEPGHSSPVVVGDSIYLTTYLAEPVRIWPFCKMLKFARAPMISSPLKVCCK